MIQSYYSEESSTAATKEESHFLKWVTAVGRSSPEIEARE